MGEWVPVPKNPKATYGDDTSPDDRLKVAYSSTTITKGCGCDVAFVIGMYTEIGHIVSALQGRHLTGKGIEWEPQTAQPECTANMWSNATMGWLGKFICLTVCTLLQKEFVQFFLWLFVFTIVCAIIVFEANKIDTTGTKNLLEIRVIVRNLSSLEALDRTYTLTKPGQSFKAE
ncbi:hypothetical protein Trisim1_003807 [Trichoderma cf. simile WF8]